VRRAGPLLAAALVGCGPPSFAAFRDQLATRDCDHAVRCGLTAVSARSTCGVPAALLLSSAGLLDVPASVAAGRLSYNDSNAQGCLDAILAAPCDPRLYDRAARAACHNVIAPAVSTGGACFGDEECVGGRCVGAPGCRGVCVAYPPPGAACAPASATTPLKESCDPTVQYCGGGGDGGGPVCQAKKGRGVACASADECSYDLVCAATCADPPTAKRGAACDDGTPCEAGNYCAAGRCAQLAKRGTPCDAPNGCEPYSVCAGGRCVAWLDLGRACDSDVACPADLSCQAGACALAAAALPGPGAACTGACAEGLYCDTGRCAYLIGREGKCSGDGCAPGLACSDGRCLAPGLACPSPPV
jgi:hypothetical protein